MLLLLLCACNPQTGLNPNPNPNPNPSPNPGGNPSGSYPILFVTQVPVTADFTTIGSVFGNQRADVQSATRGGDLWIRYPDGSLKNLTKEAGFGMEGLQGANAIAVRDPSVHWDGKKAIFSMVLGAPTKQYEVKTFYWQLYEISGLGKTDTPKISKLANQPATYNNVYPIYGTDDRIIFASDRPRGGETHLYPQLDEYEEAPTPSGLWSLVPTSGDLKLLNHAPSGDFSPFIDSFGRVVFTQWDHLQRDQQADADKFGGASYGTFNYASEAANAAKLSSRTEIFPEPRAAEEAKGTNLDPHTFNQFFPWTIREDGTESEVLNHLGRHELHGYLGKSFNDDPNIVEYYTQYPRFNPNRIENFMQIEEDPKNPGTYLGIDAPEFYTHASGQIVSLSAPPSQDADHIAVTYLTHRETSSFTEAGKTPKPEHSGHYRDPLPLSDGSLIAAHTPETYGVGGNGSYKANYDFRLKTLKKNSSGYYIPDQALTAGISKSLSYWDPDQKITFSGQLWELNPVEVKPRTRPSKPTAALETPEQQIFSQAGVDVAKLRTWLTQNNLALAVTRNVTVRDDLDRQQPFNLQVPGGVKTTGASGKVYDVAHLQFFQADLIRGLGGTITPRAGRRVIAQILHEPAALANNLPNPSGPTGSVAIAKDGSMAAFVPTRRALTWQLTDGAGSGVVRERYWLTFQPGEIRVCGSCHGLSSLDQAGHTAPTNPPQALLQLLQSWKINNP